MSESSGEETIGHVYSAQRVGELEIEVARLTAELQEERGGDVTSGASRFLGIAAATIDQAMVEIREETASAIAHVNTEVQRRRLEAEQAAAATRTEAEETAAASRAEADVARAAARRITIDAHRELEKARAAALALAENANAAAEERHRQADAEAEQVVAMARHEASLALVNERERLDREVESLNGVREALVEERRGLERYHDQLQTRVRDLAEAMVSFMTDSSAHKSLEELTIPEIESAATAPHPPAATPDHSSEEATGEGHVSSAAVDGAESSTDAEVAADGAPPAPPESSDNDGSDPQTGRSVVEVVTVAPEIKNELFAAARPGEGPDTDPSTLGRLFATGGDRLVHQTDTERLRQEVDAPAIEADARFQDFIDGDDDDDSRLWLLRSDES